MLNATDLHIQEQVNSTKNEIKYPNLKSTSLSVDDETVIETSDSRKDRKSKELLDKIERATAKQRTPGYRSKFYDGDGSYFDSFLTTPYFTSSLNPAKR